MSVDDFLGAFFRHSHRKGSPRAINYDAEARGGDGRERADERYVFALCVIGHLQRLGDLTENHLAVLRAYYLALAHHHVAILSLGRSYQDVCGRVVPDDADLQSFADWSALGRGIGSSAAHARRLWSSGRLVVSAELDSRTPTSET